MKLPFAMKVPLLEKADGERYNDEHTKVIEIRNIINTLYQTKYAKIDFFLAELLLTMALKKGVNLWTFRRVCQMWYAHVFLQRVV